MILSTLLAASLIGEANAQDDNKLGLRVKLSTPLYSRSTTSIEDFDGETVSSGISLFNGGARGEFTYMLGEGLEVGAIIGYSNISGEFDGDETGSSAATMLALTGAYNLPLGEGVRGYIQPIVGTRNVSAEAPDSDPVGTKGLTFGADLGARFRVVKRATIDLGLEYMIWNGTPYSGDDEGDSGSVKTNSLGVLFGVSTIL